MPIRTIAVETVDYLDNNNLSLKEMLSNVPLTEDEFIRLLEGDASFSPEKTKRVENFLFPGKKVCVRCGLVFPLVTPPPRTRKKKSSS